MEEMCNCHGCRWLDRYKADGNGYCCMVERSGTYRRASTSEDGKLTESSKVRRPNMERCELYEPGGWSGRYSKD